MALLDAPHPRDLTDEQWNFIGPFLPELARRKDGRGRPPVKGEPCRGRARHADARRSPAASLPTEVEGRATFTWLQNFRRIVARYERVGGGLLGMLHLACSLILLRGV